MSITLPYFIAEGDASNNDKIQANFETLSNINKTDIELGNVDNTSDVTKNAASVTLTNKTLTSPVINGTLTGTAGFNAYTSYAPTPTASSGTFTTVSCQAYYNQIGKTVHYYGTVDITNKGTADGAIFVPLPVTGVRAPCGLGVGRERNVNGFTCSITANTTSLTIFKYDNATMIVNSALIGFSVTYEAA